MPSQHADATHEEENHEEEGHEEDIGMDLFSERQLVIRGEDNLSHFQELPDQLLNTFKPEE